MATIVSQSCDKNITITKIVCVLVLTVFVTIISQTTSVVVIISVVYIVLTQRLSARQLV